MNFQISNKYAEIWIKKLAAKEWKTLL